MKRRHGRARPRASESGALCEPPFGPADGTGAHADHPLRSLQAVIAQRTEPARVGLARSACGALLLALALAAAWPGGGHAATKPGIDVSRFQGQIKWKQVGKTRVRFAFVQASRGSGTDCAVAPEHCGPDPYYERNYRLARANGIKVGPYHRAFTAGATPEEARENARVQARVFSDAVGTLRPKDLRPVLDFEHPFGGMSAELLRAWTRTWLRVVNRRFGVRPIIYTNHSSWQAIGDVRGFARRGHPLWVAHWVSRRRDVLVPAANWDGRGWAVWQYTSQGSVRGIAGPVDRNRMRVAFRRLRVD